MSAQAHLSNEPLDQSMPAVTVTRLANGLRVATLDDSWSQQSDVLVVIARMQAGSALDGELPGLARFTGTMLTRGSAGRTLEEVAEELDALGASLGTGVGTEASDGSIKCLRDDGDLVLGYLADALLRPDFPDAQVGIVRGQMLSALRQTRDSTRAEAERLMREAIFPVGHPMHASSIGDEESLAAINRTVLAEYHNLAFRPEDGIVAVAGGITHAAAVELVERHFGAWSGAPPRTVVEMPPLPSAERRLSGGLAGKSQSDLVMGLPAIQRSHPDYYALSVANLVLGRFGLMGRLGESVRERQGMAYYVYSSVEAGRSVGLWTVNAGVDPSNVERAIESTLEEVRRFQADGPTEREFSDAVGSVTGSLPLSLETSGGIANVISDIVYYELGDDYLQRYRAIMRSLTPEDILRAAREHIDVERLTISVVGPA